MSKWCPGSKTLIFWDFWWDFLLFTTLSGKPGEAPTRSKVLDFFNFNISDRAETLRIDAADELSNLAKYTHDPASLKWIPGPITEISADFEHFWTFSGIQWYYCRISVFWGDPIEKPRKTMFFHRLSGITTSQPIQLHSKRVVRCSET